jgi:hypothetical protein
MADVARPFRPADFSVFEAAKQRDPMFNEPRRLVRANLGALAKLAAKEIAKQCGVKFETKTSLNHPFTFNSYRVDALWFTLHPGKKERAPLQAILGQEFSDDLDPSYFHALLFGELRLEGFTLGVRVNERAWWDTQNLVRSCKSAEHAARLSAAVVPLAGYSMRIHDWQKLYPCEQMTPGMLGTFAQWLKPGEHRFSLFRSWSAAAPEPQAPTWPATLVAELVRLVPAWRAIAWAPDHDLVFTDRRA